MVAVTLNNLASLANQTSAITTINANNTAITNGFVDCLSVNDTSSSTMGVDLNMNGHHLINLPYPASNSEPVRLEDFSTVLGTVGVIAPGSATITGLTANQIPIAGGTTSLASSVGLSSGQLLIGQAGAPAAQTITGDTTITNTGVTTTNTLRGGNITVPNTTDTLVTLTGTQTLTNKTLTSPIISSISNTGTVTLPTSTDTLVGRATTDTLTNKTLTSPTITGSGTATLSTLTTTGAITVGASSAITGDLNVTGMLKSGGYIRQPSNFTVTSNQTLGNTALSVNLVSGVSYIIEIVLFTNTNNNSKIALAGTATASNAIFDITAVNSTSNALMADSGPISTINGTLYNNNAANTNNAIFRINGCVTCNGSGTFIVQFAQSASNATSTVLTQGSYMRVTQVA
jgi:hypothetical protein